MQLAIGDVIKVVSGEIGEIAFIGDVHFDEKTMIGIKLQEFSPNGRDGSIDGKIYFICPFGYGLFVPISNVMKKMNTQNITQNSEIKGDDDNDAIVETSKVIVEGSYARLKGLGKIPEFNGKVVKIVSYVAKKSRWKVKVLQNTKKKRYLGVREENLDPILDWELKEINVVEPLRDMPQIGDKVKTRNGKSGVVKFIGKTQFSNCQQLIGLELDDWNQNAHDGKVKGVRYYNAKHGRGYFTKFEFLIETYAHERWMPA